jgi:hypothetical protein
VKGSNVRALLMHSREGIMTVHINQRHVVRHQDGGWAVRKPHSERVSSRHPTQAEAAQRAKEILALRGGGEAVIHGRNGQIRESDTVRPASADWSLLSPEGRILFYIALCPGSTIPEVARAVGRTERSVWGTMRSLQASGMVHLRKKMRRNYYTINLDAPLLHPTISGLTLRPVMEGVINEVGLDSEDVCERSETPTLQSR